MNTDKKLELDDFFVESREDRLAKRQALLESQAKAKKDVSKKGKKK